MRWGWGGGVGRYGAWGGSRACGAGSRRLVEFTFFVAALVDSNYLSDR